MIAIQIAIFLGGAFALLRFMAALVNPYSTFPALVGIAFIMSNVFGLVADPLSIAEIANIYISPRSILFSVAAYSPFILTLLHICRIAPTPPRRNGIALTDRGASQCFLGLAIASLIILLFLMRGGLDVARLWLSLSGRTEGYEARYASFEQIIPGKFSSSLCAFAIIPTLVAVLLSSECKVSFGLRLALSSIPMGLSVIRSLATLQRGAPVIEVGMFAAIVVVGLSRQLTFKAIAYSFALLLAAAFIAALGAFSVVGSTTGGSAIRALLDRVFIIPAQSAAFYFDVFPDGLGYRGLLQSFYMQLGTMETFKESEVTVKMIGEAANGWPHNLNANFLASGYSGAGWIGILMLTASVGYVTYHIGRRFGRLGAKCAIAGALAQLQAIYFLTQADAFAAVLTGFGLGPLIVIWLTANRSIVDQSVASK